MATLLILPNFFWPIGDCINRVPLYYLFDEKKINSRKLIQNQRTIKQKKKKVKKKEKIYMCLYCNQRWKMVAILLCKSERMKHWYVF